MSEHEKVRDSVSSTYAQAVLAPEKESCCGAGSTVPKGIAAKIAGYSQDELSALPADAVVNSFGCGNPLAYAEVEEGQTVVDLGSGAGIDILIAAKKVGPSGQVIGVDMTDEMIARANENIVAAELDNVEVRKGIIEDMPIESGTVDWVISNCVINLSPEKERVFAEIARVLKPGGRMQVSDIVVEDLPDWIRENEMLYSACVSGAISEEAYLQGLRDAGLVDVEVLDRLVYDVPSLVGLIETEAPQVLEALSCCGGSPRETLKGIAQDLTGKIWSAKITARKPD